MKAPLAVICVVTCAGIAGTLTASLTGHAQPADELIIDVGECAELQSDAERYECYDRVTDAARSNRDRQADASDKRSESPPIGDREEITSSIVALDERSPNRHVITLENGQVWHQTITERFPLRVGEKVRIYPTHWGTSYRLTALDRNGFIQVKRIR